MSRSSYKKIKLSDKVSEEKIPPLKDLFRRFSHFFTGTVISRLLGIITFPILTRILSKEEYGILGLVSVTLFIFVAVAKAGLSDGITRYYKIYSNTPERLTELASTVFVRGFIFSTIVVILYIAIFPSINRYLKIDDEYITCFMIMSVFLFLNPLNIIIFNLLKVTGKTLFLNAVELSGRIVSIILSLLFILYFIRELYGYFIGIIIGEAVISIIFFYWFFTSYRVRLADVSSDLTLKLIKFGLPLLFYELSFLLLSYIDRYMIVAYHGEAVLGLYSVGYNLSMYIAEIINYPLLYSIIPIYINVYESEGKEQTEKFLERCMHYLIIAIIPISVGYFAVSKDLLVTLASAKYEAAAAFSPIILIGSLFLVLNSILNAGLYLRKKSVKMLMIMLFALIINIIMNFILLPKYGVMGATIATLVACMVTTALTVTLSYKYIIIRFRLSTTAYYLVLSGIMFLAVIHIEIPIIWLNLVVKIFAGAFIIMIGVLLKEKEITSKIKEMYRFSNA